jgi:hypothetical protein
MTRLRRFVLPCVLAGVASIAAMQARAQSVITSTYTVNAWPAGLADVPCTAFFRHFDGSWQQVDGTTIVANGVLRTGNIFDRGSDVAAVLNRHCPK